ncbi:MAG: thiamine-phosphate kinase, partial [Acidobacteriota bacterium]|nr:thiamine-phosphate kinase [Acidobacteriota bacterium]
MTVSELGEHALLARILDRLPRPGAHVLVGPGDDAAVIALERNNRLVVTTDALVEDVHFSRAWSQAEDIGHKALAVNLSDLAAMGARPRWAVVSFALPGTLPVGDVEAMVDGLSSQARAHGIAIAGGNIARSPGGLVIDVTAGGEVPSRKWLTRQGGRAGDELWLSGRIGGARAGLEMCREGGRPGTGSPAASSSGSPAGASCTTRHLRPEARVRLGLAVARNGAARAAMDLSDGLADAVRQLAGASGCGALIDATALPIDREAVGWWSSRGVDPVLAAVVGGEDYELLLAVPRRWGGRLRHVR